MCVYHFFEFYIFVLTLPLPPKTVLKNGVVETNGLSFAIKIAMSGNKFLTTMITMMRRRRRRRKREGGKKGGKKDCNWRIPPSVYRISCFTWRCVLAQQAEAFNDKCMESSVLAAPHSGLCSSRSLGIKTLIAASPPLKGSGRPRHIACRRRVCGCCGDRKLMAPRSSPERTGLASLLRTCQCLIIHTCDRCSSCQS